MKQATQPLEGKHEVSTSTTNNNVVYPLLGESVEHETTTRDNVPPRRGYTTPKHKEQHAMSDKQLAQEIALVLTLEGYAL